MMKNILWIVGLLWSHGLGATSPQLSFFNEQEGEALKELFSDTTLIPYLQELQAEIRMGMLDLSPERAEVVRTLNEAGIPVVAWLLLPKEQGYWFHSGNASDAFQRYEEVKQWAEKEGLQWSGIGIDLELDFKDIDLFKNNKWKLFRKMISRLYDKEGFLQGKKAYQQLIETIRMDGFTIESYYVPVIRYESENGRTALQQVSQFMDISTDKDIPMLYTSFIGNPYGTLKVLAIDEGLPSLAIGSTGGGIDPSLPSMSWEDLAYDLRLAALTADEIHIFCLEASVEKGFLPHLVDFDYSVPIMEYPEQVESVRSGINMIMKVSKVLSYPTLTMGVILLLLVLILWLFYRFLQWIVVQLL